VRAPKTRLSLYAGISNKAMTILNSFVNDIFERIATEASKLGAYLTISSPNKAMTILNSFVNDIFERIATEASKLGHSLFDQTHMYNDHVPSSSCRTSQIQGTH
jgi:hypothetical protein